MCRNPVGDGAKRTRIMGKFSITVRDASAPLTHSYCDFIARAAEVGLKRLALTEEYLTGRGYKLKAPHAATPILKRPWRATTSNSNVPNNMTLVGFGTAVTALTGYTVPDAPIARSPEIALPSRSVIKMLVIPAVKEVSPC